MITLCNNIINDSKPLLDVAAVYGIQRIFHC